MMDYYTWWKKSAVLTLTFISGSLIGSILAVTLMFVAFPDRSFPVLVDAYQANGLLKIYFSCEETIKQLEEFRKFLKGEHGRKALEEVIRDEELDISGAFYLGIDVPGFGKKGDPVLVMRRRHFHGADFTLHPPYIKGTTWLNLVTGKQAKPFLVPSEFPKMVKLGNITLLSSVEADYEN